MRTALLACLFTACAAATAGEPSTERFQVDGKPALLRTPAQAAPGKPWLWVAEFPGHLAAFEDAMVAEGWHIAFVDCHDQFGSPRAMRTWEALHAELTKRGLSPRPAVMGLSRGGLYALAWARLHPEKLSALYLDNGVCDARSWPGGRPMELGRGQGSPADWAKLLREFHLGGDAEALASLPQATDGLEAARDAGVILISVHGTADTVVPYAENAARLTVFWLAGGKQPILFPKEGGDHHPHGLPDMTPVVEALKKAAGGGK